MVYDKTGFGPKKFWISLILTIVFVLSQHDLFILIFFSMWFEKSHWWHPSTRKPVARHELCL